MKKMEDLLAEADRNRAARAADMPTDQDAIDAMQRAFNRLGDLGWRQGIYAPKDGTVFEVIEVGSTGIFSCYYSGEWPDGYWMTMDGGDVYPSSSAPALFRERTADMIRRARAAGIEVREVG